MKKLVLLIVCVLVMGCALPIIRYRAYEGPRRPPEEIALVVVELEDALQASVLMGGYYRAAIVEIDGQPAYQAAGKTSHTVLFKVELLPGSHTLAVHCHDPYSYSEEPVYLDLEAQAGHTYMVKYKGLGQQWEAWIEDITGSM